MEEVDELQKQIDLYQQENNDLIRKIYELTGIINSLEQKIAKMESLLENHQQEG